MTISINRSSATVYTNCKLSIYYDDKPADMDIDCIVVMDGNEIELKYDQEGGRFWSWKGASQGEGHYVVRANNRRNNAVLHQIPQSEYLNGYWSEGGFRGMWRVKLGSEFR